MDPLEKIKNRTTSKTESRSIFIVGEKSPKNFILHPLCSGHKPVPSWEKDAKSL